MAMEDDTEQSKITVEAQNIDSTDSSDALNATNTQKIKKKSLTDMLKKLHDGNNTATKDEIPSFLQKDINKHNDSTYSINGIHELQPTNQGENEVDKTQEKKIDEKTEKFGNSLSEKTLEKQETSPVSNNSSDEKKIKSGQARITSLKTNTDIYKCAIDVCKHSSSTANDFIVHINSSHPNISNIPCCFCFDSLSKPDYQSHLSSHIKNVMKCLYCQVSHDTREELLKHLTELHPNQPKKINVCIRILNNLRGKKASDRNKISPNSVKANGQGSSKSVEDKNDPAFKEGTKHDFNNTISSFTSINEAPLQKLDQTQKSRSRKSLKPVKTQKALVVEDEVEIKKVKSHELLGVLCEHCTYTTATESYMKLHMSDGHCEEKGAGMFQCNHCQFTCDCRHEFFNHLVHHNTNSQSVRFYTCPYCTCASNSMLKIEDHINHQHPEESFKFEVCQENINYLHGLLLCPVCLEAFLWKDSFIKHLTITHKLVDLSAYLNSTFSEVPIQGFSIMRSLFKNLLPDAPEFNISSLPSSESNIGDKNDASAGENIDETSNDLKNDKSIQKEDGMLIDHPLLYNMLSKTASNSVNESFEMPMLPKNDKKDYVEYTERFPPADLVKYVTKKSVPTIFSCSLCPFECSKTTHFRRHLEIHKRNESLKEGYKCGHCEFMHYRLNCIRFHLGKYHSALPYKIYRIIDQQLIILGVDDDPTLKKSKAKNPFLSSTPSGQNSSPPTTSTPMQRPERDRRPPAKLEADFSFSSPSTSRYEPQEGNMQEILTFEKQLPTSMIFPSPIQCPQCSFSNRVRINLLKHLNLHKQVHNNLSAASSSNMNDGDEEEEGEVLKNVTMSYITRANLSEEYQLFSVKLPHHNHYKCKECNFTHRYPSKVKRHFYYKHATTFPYKCGYCSFGAVEGGKVRRHCKLMHPNNSEMVVKRNVYKRPAVDAAEDEFDEAEGDQEPIKRIKLEETEEEGVKVVNEWMSEWIIHASDQDLWLPQFVTELDDVKCCKLCGYQDENNNDYGDPTVTSLRQHVIIHHLPTYPYSCQHCGVVLMDISRLKKHCDTNHPDLPYSAIRRLVDEENSITHDESSQSMADDSNFNDSRIEDSKDDEMKEFLYESLNSIPHEANTVDNNKRRYKCHYCGVVSKWNRRDIRLHILHVHMKKKVYTCKHCGFGNSKSKVLVRSHCIKAHPDRPIGVRDDLVLFNSIVPLDDSKGIVTMVMCNKEGNPILTLPQDENFDVKLIYNQRCTPSIKPTITSPAKSATSLLKSDNWKCKQCTYASTSETDVKYHIISLHLNIRPYSCPYCHVYINKSELAVAHIEKYHSDKEIKVLDTLEEKAEYLQAHMECLLQPQNTNTTAASMADEEEDEIDEGFARVMEQQTNPRYSSGYFRCMICGYRDPRNDKTKYHIIKTHLNLRQFSCPYCGQYMWGRQQVMTHIQLEHPGKEVVIQRTFHQYDDFLRKNIRKFPYNKNVSKVKSISSDSGDTPTSLVIAPEMDKKLFQCFYCDFKHALVAKIQTHCTESHPGEFMRFKQVDNAEDEFKNFSEDEDEDGGYKVKASDDGDKKGTFICQHCELVKWTEKDMEKHLLDIHNDTQPSYTFVSSDLFNESTIESEGVANEEIVPVDDDDEYFPTKKLSLLNQRQNNSYITPSGIKMTNVANTKFSHMSSSDLLKSKASLYQCSLCAYKSNKMTVMRHHVMSHLRYHPYVCPYCNVAKSVKSFPVKKHVLAKHPGMEVKALHCVDKDIEKKISDSYFKIKLSSMGNRNKSLIPIKPKPSDHFSNRSFDKMLAGTDEDENDDFMGERGMNDEEEVRHEEEEEEEEDNLVINIAESLQNTPKEKEKVNEVLEEMYKCKFCDFRSQIRSNMKHHLMKELNYKPYKCLHCSYRQTTRSSISKHHQIKHQQEGEAAVAEEKNDEKEALVLQMLGECCISKPKPAPSNTTLPKQPIQITSSSLLPMKDSKLFKCPECPYTNSTLKLVRGHMVKHGPYRLKCAYCSYKAHYPSRIRKHNRRQHHGLPPKCLKVIENDDVETKNKLPLIVKDVVPSEIKDTTRAIAPSGQVYLDGVPIDLPLIADRDGWFRCQFCKYESLNRDNFKVHLVTHRPPRWKCFYCPQKYPVVFRVRRHCSMKHPGQPVKWLDVTTKKVCGDLKTPVKLTSILPTKSILSSPCIRGQSARKSSLPLHRQIERVKRDRNIIAASQIIDDPETPSIDVHYANFSEWRNLETGLLLTRFCCHLCDYAHVSHRADQLFTHIKIEHALKHFLPTVEILPRSEGAELWALKRCGFCSFESYDSGIFKTHVRTHTHRQPVQCVRCSFASFSSSLVHEHFLAQHPHELEAVKTEYIQNAAEINEDENYEGSQNMEITSNIYQKQLTDDYTMVTESDMKRVDWSGNSKLMVALTLEDFNVAADKNFSEGEDGNDDNQVSEDDIKE